MRPLDPATLRHRCSLDTVAVSDSRELTRAQGAPGQARAAEALAFGLNMSHPGYHVFVMGAPGSGRHAAVRRLLAQTASRCEVPPDLCYVHNFTDPLKPRLLQLPAGLGGRSAAT
ncbi:Lon-like protease helical domain-containing protein [Nitrogeniibacter mangrovi]|nr:Lon-like protease helical domain-containing protein [Nitrogeniibacter mangrovi]